ncbi:MAG: hypothetical protein KJN64_12780 [Ignavibacteria bacterium]|nr:hypothetical protein [Ignavibacteria bacterium]MBT8383469.1 hypothetical protein [Ignavibacteria bacterium]MBT8391458.1 hypothetical protein [Ignavibacteria bacterium]NNJ54121.1 hypothetical protein [Ignavibacteriaceae bacterium]NNL21388.1 hypothetical protein [Ignavibacteriaceae bacterium]
MSKYEKYSELLSAYIDQELSGGEVAELEKLLTESKELRKKLDELKEVKNLTSKIKRLPESPYFETKVIAEIEKDHSGFRKFKRWTPAFALGVVTIVVMAVLYLNPNIISNFWQEQKSAIAGFYKENLHPVLYAANLTNDDIFNFAFNNQLPLNETRDKYLHVGYDDLGKEYFEIRPAIQIAETGGYDKFVSALNLNEKEKQLVDSVIGSYSEVLKSQVLVNDKNTLAISPKLWNYRKAIVTDLLIVAEKLNKPEYVKFVPQGVSIDDKIKVANAMNELKSSQGKQYIFCTPDSVFSDEFDFKLAGLEKEKVEIEKEIEKVKSIKVNLNFDSSWKKLNETSAIQTNFRIEVDSNICRVDISNFSIPEIHFPGFDSINVFIEEATKNIQLYTYEIPKIEHYEEGVKFDYYDGDSVHSFEFKYEHFNLDSAIEFEHKMFDSMMSNNRLMFKWFNDSALSKYQFDVDYFSKYYDKETMKEQMKQLKEQLNRMKVDIEIRKAEKEKGRIIIVK